MISSRDLGSNTPSDIYHEKKDERTRKHMWNIGFLQEAQRKQRKFDGKRYRNSAKISDYYLK
jgi:hypothetical protein